MNREFRKQQDDDQHDVAEFQMQSASERDEWSRVFPLDLPATHRLAHAWHAPGVAAPTTGPDGMVLRLRVVPRAELAGETVDGAGEGADGRPAPPRTADALRRELERLSKADLVTRAAEVGLALAEPQTKPVMVAALLEHHRRNAGATLVAPAR
jgi:hypothetical protein